MRDEAADAHWNIAAAYHIMVRADAYSSRRQGGKRKPMRLRGRVVAACIALLVLGLPPNAPGQSGRGRLDPRPVVLPDLRESGNGYRVTGRWATGSPLCIAFIDDVLLVGSGGNIVAYDASGSNPKLLSVVQTPGVVRRMLPYAQRLYVANDSGGVRVIDYKRPSRPDDLGGVSEWYKVRDVAIAGDLVVVAAHEDGLSIRNRSNLEQVSTVSLPGYTRRVEVLGDMAFVTSGPGTGSKADIDLYLVGISDPSSPVVSPQKYDSETGVYDFAVWGRRGYLAEGSAGLSVIGLMEKTRFGRLGSFISPAVSVVRDEDLLYCAGGRSFLVLDPSQTPPQLRGVYETNNTLGAVAARGDLAAAITGQTKVSVLNVSRPIAPSEVATLDFPGNPAALFVKGDIVYVAAGADHFEVLDVSDRSAPFRIAELVGPGIGMGVWVEGNLAYVATRVGVAIVDVEKPSEPRVAGYIGLQTGKERYASVTARGTSMYAACGERGLMIADASDPSKPAIISMTELKGWSHDVWVEEGTAYVAAQKGLALVDVHDAASPRLLNYIDTPGQAVSVVTRNGIAFIGEKNVGIEIYDCSDPSSPNLLSKLEEPGTCEGVDLRGNLLYVAAAESGVYVVDVANSEAPKVVGSTTTPGVALDVSVGEGFVAVADFTGGVAIVEEVLDDR